MEPEGSLPFSQEPVFGPYPLPDESNPHLPTLFLLLPELVVVEAYNALSINVHSKTGTFICLFKIHFNIILQSTPTSSKRSLPF
jgi:hypothetical protein